MNRMREPLFRAKTEHANLDQLRLEARQSINCRIYTGLGLVVVRVSASLPLLKEWSIDPTTQFQISQRGEEGKIKETLSNID